MRGLWVIRLEEEVSAHRTGQRRQESDPEWSWRRTEDSMEILVTLAAVCWVPAVCQAWCEALRTHSPPRGPGPSWCSLPTNLGDCRPPESALCAQFSERGLGFLQDV